MVDAERPDTTPSVPGTADWRRVVAATLKGRGFAALQSRTRDGILIEPLYEGRSDFPLASMRGSRPWTIVQSVDDADSDRANDQALEDVAGGATGLSLNFAGGPSAKELGLPPSFDAMAAALDGIDLAAIHIRIEPHPRGPEVARHLKALVARGGLAPELASIAFGLDPIGPSALEVKAIDFDADDFVACFGELRQAGFRGPLAAVDGRVYHEAGASEAQELAAIMASAAYWLRALDEAGAAPDTALPCFGAGVAADCDQFLSMAKIRATRLLWARLQKICGAPLAPIPIHASTSRHMLEIADPETNLLRNTIAVAAAGLGGADSILVHDASPSGVGSRTLSRNIHHLLMDEAHLHAVIDAASGSGAVEALTDSLAERSWAEFQTIEREGGILASLRAGAFQARVAEMRLASGRAPVLNAPAEVIA